MIGRKRFWSGVVFATACEIFALFFARGWYRFLAVGTLVALALAVAFWYWTPD